MTLSQDYRAETFMSEPMLLKSEMNKWFIANKNIYVEKINITPFENWVVVIILYKEVQDWNAEAPSQEKEILDLLRANGWNRLFEF